MKIIDSNININNLPNIAVTSVITTMNDEPILVVLGEQFDWQN